MTARDWRAGELRFLLVALIIAVASLSAVGFFIDRMRSSLNRDAHQLLGADLLVNADQPIRADWRAEAQRRGLLLADTVTFPSMAQAGEGEQSVAQLASVKAVTPGLSAARPAEDHHQRRAGQRGARRQDRGHAGARHRVGRRQRADRPEDGGRRRHQAGRQALHDRPADRRRTGPRPVVRQFRAARDAVDGRPGRHRPGRQRLARDLPDAGGGAVEQRPRRASTSTNNGSRRASAPSASRACASSRSKTAGPKCAPRWTAPTASCRWSACCRRCWRRWRWRWRRAASCCATSTPAPCCAAWACRRTRSARCT